METISDMHNIITKCVVARCTKLLVISCYLEFKQKGNINLNNCVIKLHFKCNFFSLIFVF